MAERDPSLATQHHLLASQRDFGFAGEGDEGAVAALIDQNEFVAPALDPRMHARRLAIRQDDLATGVAAEQHGGVRLLQHQFAGAMGKVEFSLRQRRRDGCRGHRKIFACLPNDFADLDIIALALDRQRRDFPGRTPQRRRQPLDRRQGSDDLHALGESCHARRHIDGVAEDVAAFLDHRTDMKTDPDRAFDVGDRGQGRYLELHVGGGKVPAIGVRQDAHDLVADGLDDAAGIARYDAPHDAKALVDQRLGLGVAQRIVQLGAARDVREQHSHFGLRHFSDSLSSGVESSINRVRQRSNCVRPIRHRVSATAPLLSVRS